MDGQIYKMNKPPPDGNRDIAPTMASPTETVNLVSQNLSEGQRKQ